MSYDIQYHQYLGETDGVPAWTVRAEMNYTSNIRPWMRTFFPDWQGNCEYSIPTFSKGVGRLKMAHEYKLIVPLRDRYGNVLEWGGDPEDAVDAFVDFRREVNKHRTDNCTPSSLDRIVIYS